MKSKLIPSLLLLAGFLVGASALSALATTFTSAPPPPPADCPSTTPGCNPPINEGMMEQTKRPLTLNFGDGVTAAPIGLTVFGKVGLGTIAPTAYLTIQQAGKGDLLSVKSDNGLEEPANEFTISEFGDMTYKDGTEGAGKILMSDEFGNAHWEEPEQAEAYSCTLVNDSLDPGNDTANIKRWQKVTIPTGSTCKSDEGCIIKQELYAKKNGLVYLHSIRQAEYFQTEIAGGANDTWWSTANKRGTTKNGDTSSSNILGGRADSTILLRDDRNTVTYNGIAGNTPYLEVTESEWSAYDATRGYGQKLYVCSGPSSIEGEDL